MKKRILAGLMALVMAITLLPAAALAKPGGPLLPDDPNKDPNHGPTYETPTAPSQEQAAAAIGKNIWVYCSKDNKHDWESYSATAGSITKIDTPKYNGRGNYYCDVTLSAGPYVDLYNQTYTGTAHTAKNSSNTKTLRLYYDWGTKNWKGFPEYTSWSIEVACKSVPPVPPEPGEEPGGSHEPKPDTTYPVYVYAQVYHKGATGTDENVSDKTLVGEGPIQVTVNKQNWITLGKMPAATTIDPRNLTSQTKMESLTERENQVNGATERDKIIANVVKPGKLDYYTGDNSGLTAADVSSWVIKVDSSASDYEKDFKNVTNKFCWHMDGKIYVQQVKYDSNYPSGSGMTAATKIDETYYLKGASATAYPSSTFTAPTNKMFKEWNTQANGNGTSYQPGAAVPINETDVTLYAIWDDAYTLTYNANGGYFGDDTDAKTKADDNNGKGYAKNTPVTLATTGDYIPTHAKQGNNNVLFLGWTTTAPTDETQGKVYTHNEKLPDLVPSVTIPENTTVYAVWGLDALGRTNNDGTDTGDGIPDVYQAKITYQIVNGSWSSTAGDNADRVEYVDLKIKGTDGVWTAVTNPVLANVPSTEFVVADTYHKAPGSWSPSTPTSGTTTVTGDATYTYTLPQTYSVTYQFIDSDGNTGTKGEDYPDTSSLTVTLPPVDTDKYAAGETVTLATVIGVTDSNGTDWTFNGWNSAKNSDGGTVTISDDGKITMPASNVTITGTWTKSYTYTLTYDENTTDAVSGLPDTQTQKTDAETHTFDVSTTEPTRDGYTFLGWNTDKDATAAMTDNTVTLTSTNPSKILYAVWQKNAEPDPPTDPVNTTSVYVYFKTVDSEGNNITNVTGVNYTSDANKFGDQHWATLGELKTTTPVNASTSASDLASQLSGASFTRLKAEDPKHTHNQYTGTGPDDVVYVDHSNESVALNLISNWSLSPVSSGADCYKLSGNTWHLDGTVTGYRVIYKDKDSDNEDIELTSWVDDNNPNTNPTYYLATATPSVTDAEPTKDGFTFQGWNTKADGTGTTYTAGSTVSFATTDDATPYNDVILYAVWEEDGGDQPTENSIFYLCYDKNGGTGIMSNDPVYPVGYGGDESANYPNSVTVVASTFTDLANKVFKEWNTKADGTGTTYAVGTTFAYSAFATDGELSALVNEYNQVILYAIWKSSEQVPESNGSLTIKKAAATGTPSAITGDTTTQYRFTVTGPNYSNTVTLAMNDEATLTNLAAGKYTVTETTTQVTVGGTTYTCTPAYASTSGGNLTPDGGPVAVIDPNQVVLASDPVTMTVTNTYTAKNTPPTDPGKDTTTCHYYAFRKVDAQDGKGLKGATFGLYLNDGTRIATAPSIKDGYVTFQLGSNGWSQLNRAGSAYFQEITPPDGYARNETKYSVSANDFSTSAIAQQSITRTVLNYRTATPGLLNDSDHFAYVQGYKDGTVRPNGLISRAETTTIFFRLLKDTERDGNLRYSNDYTDVSDSYWANTAISTMSDLGIIQGYSNGSFNPAAPITRAQFAAICARFDTQKTSNEPTNFTDTAGHWAEGYIQRAVELGWIKGFEDGSFRPDAYITRAQAMTLINRVLNRIPEDEDDLLSGMTDWPDCKPGSWCYLAVQEATNSHNFKSKSGNYETWTSLKAAPDWSRYEN